MNKITQRLIPLITANQPSRALNLGRGLYLRYTIIDNAPRVQIWRVNEQTSDLEATTVANALKAALRQIYPQSSYLVRQSRMQIYKGRETTYHGCSFTWEPSPALTLTLPTPPTNYSTG